jgi:murein L,D-transpeptidase YcbB/YkuD
VQNDLGYLMDLKFRVFTDWSATARELDPQQIDWSELGAGKFPFKLRQDPGPKNALGRVKFMFPNVHNVYLHDTPSRDLFDKAFRAFSSGCIRVEDPLALAEFVLDGDPRWPPEAVRAVFENGETTTVSLRERIPVHITYFTAWIGEGGTIHFRDDIYERDARLGAALFETTKP